MDIGLQDVTLKVIKCSIEMWDLLDPFPLKNDTEKKSRAAEIENAKDW